MKKKILNSIIILLILFFFIFSTSIENIQLERKLKKLEPIEQEYLHNFFQYLIRISSFGYVLFGDKPMSIEFIDYSAASPSIEGFDYMDNHHIVFKYRFKEGWKTWKKYENLFSSKNFAFIDYPHALNSNYKVICLINKEKFMKTIQDNIQDFQSVLRNQMSPHEILNDYLNQGKSFTVINNHDGLFGTLLGYGRDNAWTFMETAEFENRSLVSFVKSFCKENHEDVCMNLPGFMVLPNTKETINLAFKYKKQRLEIEKICNEQGFLIPSLKKIHFNKI